MRLERLIPAAGWLRRYRREDLPRDLSAGLVVAVMLIPQGMAYAMLAGMPPVAGLYAATVPLFAYALFGSSRQLAVGPVALVSLLTISAVSQLAPTGTAEFAALAALLALLVGALQTLMGFVRAGFLANFLSHAVVSGFTSAAAILIGLSQLQHLLGVPLEADGPIHALLWEALSRFGEASPATLMVGLAGIALLVASRRLAPRFPAPLLLVAAATLAAYLLDLPEAGVAIVGQVPGGLPRLALPSLNASALGALLPAAITIAFVGFMESLAVAKSLAARERYSVDANRELVGLGVANLAAGVFSAFPVTGGFSRSAVNYQAGARTPLASMVTALLITLTLLFFTPLFTFLPRTVLAAIVIVAVAGLIDLREPARLFRVKPADGWTLLVTFAATLLLGVELGILIGVGFSLLLFVARSAYPHTAELGRLPGSGAFRNLKRFPEAVPYRDALIVRPDASLYFANTAFLASWLEERLTRPGLRFLLLDFSGVNDIDAVALQALEELTERAGARGIEVHVAGMKGPVRDVAARAGWYDRFGARVEHLSLEDAARELALEPAPLTPPEVGVSAG